VVSSVRVVKEVNPVVKGCGRIILQIITVELVNFDFDVAEAVLMGYEGLKSFTTLFCQACEPSLVPRVGVQVLQESNEGAFIVFQAQGTILG